MVYINIHINYKIKDVETVDEFETLKEAKEMIKEYRTADSYSHYYLSQRATKEWRTK